MTHLPSNETCDVGILFALEIEAGGLLDLLDRTTTFKAKHFRIRQGTLRDRRVAVVTSGAGQSLAEQATEMLITGHRPRWIISAGFSGGLSPKLGRHDILMADTLVDTNENRFDLELKIDQTALPAGIHVGTLLSTEKIIRLPEDKRELGERYGALAVDTESMAVARACRASRTPMLAVRILTDAVDETLPADVQHLTDQKTGPARLGAALATLWRRPSSIKELWALKENALVASDRLAQFIADLIENFPPNP